MNGFFGEARSESESGAVAAVPLIQFPAVETRQEKNTSFFGALGGYSSGSRVRFAISSRGVRYEAGFKKGLFFLRFVP